ncbi:MAG TPA: phosphonate C-P lyase system protein PhnG [Beijerinckiaceae bacterium]|jgi:alpha-D-ribose 1-methylphosphonate 5-triphosphate synthase subunit PhnG
MSAAASTKPDPLTSRRQAVMALCAEATRDELADALARLGHDGAAEDLRRPETGLVMMRGRVGGEGAPFNVGEASVARAAVRLPTGETGFAYQLGRDVAKARLAAILDALVQARAEAAVQVALAPVRQRLAADRERSARETAATRVNFFTLVRGED